jgi:putative redox protein
MSEQVGSRSNGSKMVGPREVVARGNAERFTQEIIVGPHHLTADEPEDMGGDDEGPTPYDLLLAALVSAAR